MSLTRIMGMSKKRNPARALSAVAGLYQSEIVCQGSDGFRRTKVRIDIVAEADQQTLIDQLRPVISDERIGTYLTASGFDVDRAMRLYIWNALIGEAFHLPIQSVKVGLRNRINTHLIQIYGLEWWQTPAFLSIVTLERKTDIEVAVRRIRNRRAKLTTGQVVATLSFGFWASLLHKRYNPSLWGGRLHTTFPAFPRTRTRADLAERVKRTADFRNRVWHHEPIVKAAWVRPHCRVSALMREKP